MIDIVILSNAKNPELKRMTQKTIDTACLGRFGKIIVIEQNEDVAYGLPTSSEIINPIGDYNYNQFANIGAAVGSSEWICIANNDLIFTPNWFDQLMKVKHPLMSPKCPKDKRQADVMVNETGTQVGRHLSGWCFVIRRDVWEQIGGFDEDFSFWCADNSLMEQLIAIGITPMIVANSIVEHLGSQTLKTVDDRDPLTRHQVLKFNRKYNQNLFGWGK